LLALSPRPQRGSGNQNDCAEDKDAANEPYGY